MTFSALDVYICNALQQCTVRKVQHFEIETILTAIFDLKNMILTQGCQKMNKVGGASSEGWAESAPGLSGFGIIVKFEVYVLSISSGDFIKCRSLKRKPLTFNEISKSNLKLLTSVKVYIFVWPSQNI